MNETEVIQEVMRICKLYLQGAETYENVRNFILTVLSQGKW